MGPARTLIGCTVLLAGCLGSGGSVTLTVSQAMSLSPAVTGYQASNATAVVDGTGVVHCTASSSDGLLTLVLQGPLKAGGSADLTVAHNSLSYDQTGAGWSSNGGTIAVDGVAPYRLRFVAVPMVAGSGAAKGSLVLDGSGTFD